MRAELAAHRRVLVTFAALLLSVLAGVRIGSQSAYVAAQQPDHLVAAPILHAGVTPQVWMSAPFCVATWFDGSQCAEHKGDEHGIGADWKLDLPPAWLTLVGRRQDGAWLLSAVSMANDQPPAPWFIAVSGPTLITVSVNESPVTPSPLTATGTPPPNGATATGTSTPEPSPQVPTPTPTRSPTGTPRILYGNMCSPNPTPEYPHQMVIVGITGAVAPDFVWWCIPPNATPDLVIVVPMATYQAAYDDGPRKLLQSLGR